VFIFNNYYTILFLDSHDGLLPHNDTRATSNAILSQTNAETSNPGNSTRQLQKDRTLADSVPAATSVSLVEAVGEKDHASLFLAKSFSTSGNIPTSFSVAHFLSSSVVVTAGSCPLSFRHGICE
jgi:hypothetical protein